MKPAAFAYHAPEGVDEALALLAEHGPEAKPLAGGQSLVAAMNVRHAPLLAEARRMSPIPRSGTGGR